MKKCPFCQEEIQDTSVKCRYCGEWLDKENLTDAPPMKSISNWKPLTAEDHALENVSNKNPETKVGSKKKSKAILLVLIIVSIVFVGLAFLNREMEWGIKSSSESTIDQEGINNKRIDVIQRMESRCQKFFHYKPIIKFGGPNNTFLIVESIRLDRTWGYMLVDNRKTGNYPDWKIEDELKELRVEKIVFIQQRYNEREVSGWTYNLETRRFE